MIVVFYILIWYIDGVDGALIAQESFQKSIKSLNELKDLSRTVMDSENNGLSTIGPKKDQKDLLDTLSKITSGAEGVGSKIKALYDDIYKLNKKASNEEAESIKQDIDVAVGVANGLVSVVQGIRDKNFLSIVTGSLDIVSTILSITGPAGAIAGSVISLISFGLSAFFAKEQKSQTQIILDGVKNIIKENEYQKLKDKIENYFNELSYLEQDIVGLMEFIQPNIINENSNLEKIATFLTRNQDKIDKYDREVLNQLKIEVQRDCSLKNCNECLSKMQYYFIASNRYEILALHLVGLYELILQSIKFVTSKNDYNSLKRRMGTKSSDRKMFLDYLLNQKRSSSYNVQEWKCVAEYYKYPGKFEFIDFLVKYSAENTESSTSLIVYIGKDENFDEYNSYITDEKKEVNLKVSANFKDAPWLSELRWIFVPPKCKVDLFPDNNEAKKVDMTSNSIEIKGPTLVQVPKITYKGLYIQRSVQLSGEYIRICKKPKMEGACFQIEPKYLSSQRPIPMLFPAESLYIPSGWKVNIHTTEGFFNTEKNFINIKGPLTLEYICREGSTLVELSGFSNINPPKNEVKICSEINFGGWCDYIDTQFEKNALHSCDWKNIRSFEIPKSKEMKVKTDCLSCFRGPDIAGYTKSSSDTEITKIVSVSVVSFNVKKSQF